MRLMALLTVASRAAGGAVALSEVRGALDIPEDEVQPWIVKAIGRKLIEGKIDQVRLLVRLSSVHFVGSWLGGLKMHEQGGWCWCSQGLYSLALGLHGCIRARAGAEANRGLD